MSEASPATGQNVAEKEESVIVNDVSVGDGIVGIPFLTEDALTTLTTHGPDNGIPDGNSRIAAIMQFMIKITISAKFESASFAIHLFETLEDIVWSPRYFVKVTVALPNIDDAFDPLAHVVKSDADSVIDVSSIREDRIEVVVQAAARTVSACYFIVERVPTNRHFQ